jgi:hypothetical protein
MDGFPKLIHVETSDRDGKKAYFDDGMVAEFDYALGIWRPATAHISYRDLFTETVKRERLTDNTSIADASFVLRTRATDALNLELAPDVAEVD